MPSGSRKCTLGSIAASLLPSGIILIFIYKFGNDSRFRNRIVLILGILFTIVGFFLSCIAFLIYVTLKAEQKDVPLRVSNNGTNLNSRHSSQNNAIRQSLRDQNFRFYRDGNRYIPVSNRHRLSASAPDPTPDSALPIIHSEDYSEPQREMGSSGAPYPRSRSPSGTHLQRRSSPVEDTSNTIRAGSHHIETIPTPAERAPCRTPIPSPRSDHSITPSEDLSIDLDGVFANIDNGFSDITGHGENRNSQFAPPDNKSDVTSHESSAPPPSYQEVMEGGYPELSPTYQHTIFHPGQSRSANE